MRTYYLYTLNDPRINEIKYVGITCNLERRLYDHIKDPANTKKTRWIQRLKNAGVVPTINEIKHTNDVNTVIQWEIETIAEYRKIYDLTNTTNGGEYWGIGTPVAMYDLDGNFIDSFTSMIEVTEVFGWSENVVGCISACCMHHRNYTHGHIWRYLNETVTKEDVQKVKESLAIKEEKHFYLISLDGSIIHECTSVETASEILNRKKNGIYETLKADDDRLINGFFICKEKDDYQKKLDSYNNSLPEKVKQYTLNGEYIATHNSLLDAAKSVGKPKSINIIRSCCLKKYKQGLGYIWQYESDNTPIESYTGTIRKINCPVYMLTLNNEFIKKFEKLRDAVEYIRSNGKPSASAGGICQCISGKTKSAYGYKWTYEAP